MGATALPRAGAGRPAPDGVPRRHERERSPEGGQCRQKRGSAAERDHREALGQSRGGYGAKACVITDGSGRTTAFWLAPGQAHELPHAVPLLDQLPGVRMWIVGDRGYTSHSFRAPIWERGCTASDRAAAPRGARRLPGLDLQQAPPRRAALGSPEGVARHRNHL